MSSIRKVIWPVGLVTGFLVILGVIGSSSTVSDRVTIFGPSAPTSQDANHQMVVGINRLDELRDGVITTQLDLSSGISLAVADGIPRASVFASMSDDALLPNARAVSPTGTSHTAGLPGFAESLLDSATSARAALATDIVTMGFATANNADTMAANMGADATLATRYDSDVVPIGGAAIDYFADATGLMTATTNDAALLLGPRANDSALLTDVHATAMTAEAAIFATTGGSSLNRVATNVADATTTTAIMYSNGEGSVTSTARETALGRLANTGATVATFIAEQAHIATWTVMSESRAVWIASVFAVAIAFAVVRLSAVLRVSSLVTSRTHCVSFV